MYTPQKRIIFISILFLSCSIFTYAFDNKSETPITKSLQYFPLSLGKWQALSSESMSENMEGILGVDDYILRDYRNAQGVQVNVFISYFSYTDRNKGYHSPLNCMPGSDWNIIQNDPVAMDLPGADQVATVSRLIMQNGHQKMVSLYWYQCRGRILHNEYVERIYRVLDSIFMNRTDGAFIRLMAMNPDQGMQENANLLKDFATRIIPELREYLPE